MDNSQHTPPLCDFGQLYLFGRNPGHEKPCITYSSTTQNAGHDAHVMTGSLELEQAVRLRGVKIAPHAIGALIVVGPNVSLWALVTGWLRERKRAFAAIAAATGSTHE